MAALPPPGRDPVFSRLTPSGAGAIAAFILDGDGALARFAPLFDSPRRAKLLRAEPGALLSGRLRDLQGRLVDEVVAAPLRKDRSETGCEQVELCCHGGAGAMEAVAQALVSAGFRPAGTLELAARAHRAARLSLPALEARLRLRRAATARQAEFLLAAGEFQRHWERLGLEAGLAMRRGESAWRGQWRRAAEEALRSVGPARRLLQVHRVALAGPVNSGKSSLANRLLRAEELLAGPEPGTTRDLLERPAQLRGLALLLCDGAGSRPAAEELEREGQARARAAAQCSDLILLVMDGSRAPLETEVRAATELISPANRPSEQRPAALLALNKNDLGTHAEADGLPFGLDLPAVRVSALTGAGLEALEEKIESLLLGGASPAPGAPFTLRQARRLAALRAGLEEGMDIPGLLGHIRALVGTCPNEPELAAVIAEAEEGDGP